jgi:hypothetical protein
MGRTLSSDSANVINLPASTTGFTAGDYVYQSAAGYGVVPNGALATGMFNAPVASYSATATTYNELTYVEQLGGSQGSQVAAQLTNGNIVYAYVTGNTGSYPAAGTVNFRIETTAGTPVVAQTSTTMTVLGPGQVSVIALPAGGFTIVCTPLTGSNFNLNARFYAADGTAATAVLNASLTLTGTVATSRLKLQSLSDGSVIIGYAEAGVFSLRRVSTAGFDATFGTSGLVSVVTFASATQFWDFATDSSNNIQVIFNSSATSLTMRRYNSSGVQQTTSSVTSLTGIAAVAITITSDAVIRGFAQDGAGIVVITWDGTTAAVGTRIISSASLSANAALGAFAQGASGGYVIFYSAPLSSTSGIGLFLQPFSSLNVSLASAVRVNPAIGMNYRNQFTPIVVSGNTRVYFGTFPSNAVSYTLNSNVTPMGIAYFAYSNSTYALVGTPATASISIGPYSLGAYLRGVSTATVARFTIATTGSYPTSYAAGSTLIPKTLIDGSNAVNKLVLAPLPNGEFVAVWARVGSPYQIFISKYSSTGALLTGPVTVEASGSSNANTHAVAPFANGNILVAYEDSTAPQTLRYRIYTSSLTVVTSGNIDTAAQSNPRPTATSFGDGSHVAVSFIDNTDNVHVRAVRNDGTVTARLGPGLTVTTSWACPQVIGLKSSGFMLAAQAQDGSNNMYSYGVRQTGASSFIASGAATIQSGSNFGTYGTDVVPSTIPSPGTTAYCIGTNSANSAYRAVSMNPLFNAANSLDALNFTGAFAGLSLNNTTSPSTIGYTATGTPVIVTGRAATTFVTLSPFTMSLNGSTSIDVTAATTTTLQTQTGSTSSVSAIPHLGEAILIGYIDASRSPAFASIAVMPFTVNTTLTAGVDASTSTLSLTPESGYSLQGISVTAAASGSIGLVQTRGTATLNSNYSAATPATFFDFRNPLTFGANGIVIGRTVTMGNN